MRFIRVGFERNDKVRCSYVLKGAGVVSHCPGATCCLSGSGVSLLTWNGHSREVESVVQSPGGKDIALAAYERLRSLKETRRDDHPALLGVLKSFCQGAWIGVFQVKSLAML